MGAGAYGVNGGRLGLAVAGEVVGMSGYRSIDKQSGFALLW